MLRKRLALVGLGLALGLVGAVVLGWVVGRGDGRELPEYRIESAGAGSYFSNDPDLGYAPPPSIRARSWRLHEDEPIYDVRYTIDAQRLRVTPGVRKRGRAVVFFGGSYTFGEGVEDEETMPASVGRWLRGRTKIVNAGFHGYGPHQMLRALETDRLDPILGDGVEHVIYQGIDGHVRRSAGRTTWDLAGPAYELRDGTVEHVGPFRGPGLTTVGRTLNRFGPTRALLAWWLTPGEAEAARDRELYVEIVARAAQIVRDRYGARFSVVYWDHADDPIPEMLEARGLDLIRVSNAFEGQPWRRFVLDVDRHPSRRGHAKIGRAVARRIQEGRRTTARESLSSRKLDVVDRD